MDWLLDNWLFVLSIIVSIVITWVFAEVYHRRGKKEKAPRYTMLSVNFVPHLGQIPKISVHYEGHGDPIPNLTFTLLWVWNDGREPIKKQDMPKESPLTLIAKEGVHILESFIAPENRPNRFTLSRNREKTKLGIGFEYVDGGEGVFVGILHTGRSDEDLKVEGRVIGAGEFVRVPYTHGVVTEHVVSKRHLIVLGLVLGMICLDGLVSHRVPLTAGAFIGYLSSATTQMIVERVKRRRMRFALKGLR